MILIPPGMVRAFRAIARKCSTGRPKGPAPPVIVVATRRRLSLVTVLSEVVVALDLPPSGTLPQPLAVPSTAFDAADTAGAVELVPDGLAWQVRWTGTNGPQMVSFEPIPHTPPLPPRPGQLADVPPTFLTALHECGRVTARDAGTRYATNRVQVQGANGLVVGTDGHQALLWGGFALPFDADVLVPVVPVFGTKTLATESEVRVGRTDHHLVVAAGPWLVFLRSDVAGRFPDVRGAVPRAHAPVSVLDLGDADAERCRVAIAGRTSADDESTATLDVGPSSVLRAGETPDVVEVPLPDASCRGPSVTVTFRRSHLLRALTLGFRRLRVVTDGKPVAFEDGDRTYITMPIGNEAAVPKADESASHGPSSNSIPEPRSHSAMRPHETNGHHGGADPPDVLAEAEALKAALAEASHRANRLVQALKHGRKQTRALASAWSALKGLNLDPGGRP